MACIARDNALEYLIKEGAVDTTRKIVDRSLFDSLNNKLTTIAVRKYNMDMLDMKLFSISETNVPWQRNVTTSRELNRTVRRAVPNQNLFLELDRRIKAYVERSAQPVVLNDDTTSKIDSQLDEVWTANPTLQKIGTRDQYKEYIESLLSEGELKETVVKEVVYHDTPSMEAVIEDLTDEYIGKGDGIVQGDGIYFYRSEYGRYNSSDYRIPALILLKKPFRSPGPDGLFVDFITNYVESIGESPEKLEINSKNIPDIRSKNYRSYAYYGKQLGYDGVIAQNEDVVFDKSQIYQLGNQKDLTGFAKFLGNYKSKKNIIENLDKEILRLYYKAKPEVTKDNIPSGLEYDLEYFEEMTIDEINNLGVQEATEVMTETLSQKLGIGYERVTSDEAVEILSNRSIGYNGEPGFYFAGKVYLVGENVTMNTVLHEFGHPLVMAIKQLNSKLFDNLVELARNTTEGEVIEAEIKKEYPKLNKESDLFKEELLTYSLQVSAANKVNEQIESKGFRDLITKLLASLKDLLRQVFGKSKKVSDLDVNTTLEELTDKLLGDKKIDLELARVTDDGIVRFGKMLIERAKAVTDSVQSKTISKMIDQFNSDASALITEARKYKGFDANARKTLEKAFFDGGKLLPAVKRSLRPYIDENIGNLSKDEALDAAIDAEEKRIEDVTNRATALVSSITTMNNAFKNVNTALDRLSKKKNFGSSSDVALAGLMKMMSRRMFNSINDLNQILDEEKDSLDQNNPFQELLRQVKEQAEKAEKKVKDLYRKHAGQFFVEITGYMNQYLENELKTDLGAALANGLTDEEATTFINKVIQQKLTEEDVKELESKGINVKLTRPMWQKYQKFILDVPKFNKILSGEFEDVSLVNRFLEAYSSSNNPIVGSLSIWINDKKTEAENRSYNKSMELRKKLAKILPQIGYSKNNTRAILDKAFMKDQVFDVDRETGEAVATDVYTLLQKFGNGWRFQQDKLLNDIAVAKRENDSDKIRESEYALKVFNDDYMHREYVPEFYEKDDIWSRDALSKQAWLERKLALDKINSIENRTEGELERLSQYTTLQDAKREYKQLYSMRNEDGTMKIGDEKIKTEIRLEHRALTSKFYETVDKPNSIQESFNDFINKLESENISQLNEDGTPNDAWSTYVEEWIRQNTRTVYTDAYYTRRGELFDELGELNEKARGSVESEFNVADAYSEIYDILGMYRDDQGQPIPEELGANRIARIKELQQKINNYQESVDSTSSLTSEERTELNTYNDMIADQEELNDIQKERFKQLTLKDSEGLNGPEIVRMKNIFKELRELTSKKVTDYYLDELNVLLSAFELAPVADPVTALDYINSDKFRELLTDDSDAGQVLAKWFEENHVSKKQFVKGQNLKVDVFVPIPAHMISVPSDKSYIKSTPLTNPLTDETINIEGAPNNRHTTYKIKNEYRTLPFGLTQEEKSKYIGRVIDNANNFLPRDYVAGNKYSAKDDTFISKEYAELNPASAEFQLVKALEEYMLDVQNGKSSYSKLYLDLPRFATNSIVESFQKGKFGSRLGQAKQAWQDWYSKSIGIGSKNKTGADQYLDQSFNYDADNNLVNTNLDGEEVSYIPVEGLFKLDINRVDPDVIQSVLKYGMSLEAQSVLFENLPFAEAILDTLEESAPKNMKGFDKTAAKLGKKKRPSKKFATNHSLEQMKSLINREFYGIVQSDFVQRNPEIAKIVSTLQRMSTVSALALNIPSDLKNKYGAMVQVAIEAAGHEFFGAKDFAAGRKFAFEAMMNWSSFGSKGIYAIGPSALTTQLIEIYDPVFKTKDEFGRSVQRSMWKDLVNGEWLYMHRRFGEMEVGITLFGSFMNGTKIEQNIDGEKRIIKLKDAYQQDQDGVIRLKKGIDLEWNNVPIYHELQEGEKLSDVAKNYGISLDDLKANNRINDELEVQSGDRLTIASSKKFKALRNRIQGVSRYLFGAYDQFGQAEGNKLIIYRMFMFMRKWFVPLWMNRWGMDFKNRKDTGGYRYDFATGTVSKGFYIQNFGTLKDLITSQGEKFKYMTTREKVAYKKAAFEGLFIMASALISSMLFGFDEDDDDKWTKVRSRTGAINQDSFNAPGFLVNHALLLLKGVQAETTTYMPLPNIFGVDMGLNDQIGLIQNSSISFGNTVALYAKLLQDTFNFLAGSEKAYYQKKSGPYPWKEKGDVKIISDMMRIFGFTGNTFDTETALKNLERSKERR